MVKKAIFLICTVLVLFLNSPAYALTEYYVNTAYGGTWHDAEKSPSNNQDDAMCWAAAASNILAWSGWTSSGLTDTDAIFRHYQDNWTNYGGWSLYGLKWWFNGVNDKAGVSGWSQVDATGGGGFYPDVSFSDYLMMYGSLAGSPSNKYSMQSIETMLTGGYGVNIGLRTLTGAAHAITVWGYAYDETDGDYLGLMVTDSDDGKLSDDPPDQMTYVSVRPFGDYWWLYNYSGADWYISDVVGLKKKPTGTTYSLGKTNPLLVPEPTAAPEPPAILLLLAGLTGLAVFRKKVRD